MLERWPFRTALLFVTLSTACNNQGESKSAGSGSDDELTQSEFITTYRELVCTNLERCCSDANLTFDAAACAARFADQGQGTSASVFSPSFGAACLSELEGAKTCGAPNAAPSCNRVYSGTLAPGDSCSSNLDCSTPADGIAVCDGLLGRCVVGRRGGPGYECQQSCAAFTNGNTVCAWGPASIPNADGSVVVNCYANDGLLCGDSGRCVALSGLGQPCIDDGSCERTLFCAITPTGNQCQPRREVGQACSEYTLPCVTTAFCGAGTCVARKSNGQRCLGNGECLGVCDCGVGGDCASQGVCTDPNALIRAWNAALITAAFCGS